MPTVKSEQLNQENHLQGKFQVESLFCWQDYQGFDLTSPEGYGKLVSETQGTRNLRMVVT